MCDDDDAGDGTTHIQRAQWLVGRGGVMLRCGGMLARGNSLRLRCGARRRSPSEHHSDHHADHPASQHLQ